MKKIIFAVEDESSIRELYKYALTDYEVHTFECGKDMFEGLVKLSPDLFILDIMLPDMSGNEIIEVIKKDFTHKLTPIIMVSAKGDELSKVKSLNLGADDYLAKPFGVMELNSRINANLRKSTRNALSYLDVEIDERVHTCTISGSPVALTLKEYQLLKYLMSHSNQVCLRDHLLSDVWGVDCDIETRTLDSHINMLRNKLSASRARISTVRGVGYMLSELE